MKTRPRDDLDKPRHQPSLIRVFVVHTVNIILWTDPPNGLFMLTGKTDYDPNCLDHALFKCHRWSQLLMTALCCHYSVIMYFIVKDKTYF